MEQHNASTQDATMRLGFGYSNSDGGRFLIHAGNIVAVFSNSQQMGLARAINPGDPLQPFTAENADQCIKLNAEDDLDYDFFPMNLDVEEGGCEHRGRLSFRFKATYQDPNGVQSVLNQCDAVATHEGLIINLYADVDGDFEEIDSIALMYSD